MSRAVVVDGMLYPSVAEAADVIDVAVGRLHRALVGGGEVDGHTAAYADCDARRMIPTRCPRCGCTEAEQRFRLTGGGRAIYDLEERTADYTVLHDSIGYAGGTVLYCRDCGRRLGSVDDARDFSEV